MKFKFGLFICSSLLFILTNIMSVFAQDGQRRFYIAGTITSKSSDTSIVIVVTPKGEAKIPIEKDGHFKQEFEIADFFIVKIYRTNGTLAKEIKIDPKSLPGVDIGVIEVDEETVKLKEVQIKGRQILAKSTAQKTTYQIEGNKSFLGDNIQDVLSKLPGLFYYDNVLNVNGSSNVRISLNGKEYKFPDSKAKMDFLKSLSATDVKNIEVYNPSAKNSHSDYVLNINSKDLSDGFSVSPNINFYTGRYSSLNTSVFAQMKKSKIASSLYSSIGYEDAYQSQQEQNTFSRAFLNSTGNLVDRKRSSYNQLDLDYSASKRTLVGISVSGSFFNSKATQNNQFRTAHPTSDSTLNNISALNKRSQYLISNLLIRHLVDTNGSEISLVLDANHFNAYAQNEFSSNVVSPVQVAPETFFGYSENQTKISVLGGALNFKSPFSKRKGLIETGIRASSSKSNQQNYLETVQSYLYEDQLASIYGNLNYMFTGSSLQLGIRAEAFKLNSGSLMKKYHYFLPFFSYATKLFHSTVPLTLQYTSRAGRPSFFSYNPAVNVRNLYSSYSGNPDLGISKTNEFNVTASWKDIYLFIGYSEVKNGNLTLPLVNGENTLKYIPVQIKRQHSYNLGISYNLKIDNISLSANTTYSNQWFNDNRFVALRSTADLIYVMNDGEIIETGTHEQLIEQKGKYYALVINQLTEKPSVML